MIDAHHHLWDLSAVSYPWIMDETPRFFGDHAPIRRDFLIDEYRKDAAAVGIRASVHIQVGAADPMEEARWVQSVADANLDWPLVQVAFCDLTAPDFERQLDLLQTLPSVRAVRQIVGRAPEEDAQSGTNGLIDNPLFLEGLRVLGDRGLGFDLQLIPELMAATARVIAQAPKTKVALCHAGSPYDRTPEGLKLWRNNLKCMSELSNVWCKISGLGMFEHNWTSESISPIVETCLDQFSSSRCMFGSNFPVDSLYSDYGYLFSSITKHVEGRDFGALTNDTAKTFYNVDI